jgi:hypothetical protein
VFERSAFATSSSVMLVPSAELVSRTLRLSTVAPLFVVAMAYGFLVVRTRFEEQRA